MFPVVFICIAVNLNDFLCLLGPAFIKWGQWASTRPDIFPADICEELSKLHMQVCEAVATCPTTCGKWNFFLYRRIPQACSCGSWHSWCWQAPKHSYAETRKIMQKAFRVPIEDIFDDFEEEPVASGSIAQVGTCNVSVAYWLPWTV